MRNFLTSLYTPELRTKKIDTDPPGSADITMGTSLNVNGHTFYGFPTPVNSDWAATKGYVDSQNTKQACRMATTASITLSGAPTVDGLTPQPGDRVLVKNQSPTGFNGIYVAAAGAWTRATDNDSEPEMNNAFVWIAAGTANADTAWLQTIEQSSLGTDSQSWVKKLGTGAITSSDIGFNAIYQGHINDGEVTIPKLSATGTKDGTTFLRGDNTWAVPAGGGGAGGGSEPIGSILMWPTATPPANWLLCDGTAIPAQYTTLIALVGANTPDYRDLLPMGASATKALGVNGGVASHSHPLSANGYALIGLYGTIIASRRIAVPNYAETHRSADLTSGTPVNPAGQGAMLGGDTDGVSTLPPYKGTHFIIKAAAPNAVVNSYQTGLSNSGSFSAVGTDKTVAVTFPVAFASTPSVSLTVSAASSQNIRYPVTLVSKSTTGFSYCASRAVGTGALDVEWQAMLL